MKLISSATLLAMSTALLAQTAPAPVSGTVSAAHPSALPPPPLDPAEVLAAFAPGPGREVTAAACGACHSPSIITGKQLDADAWALMVDQMIGRGAPVEDKDYDTIIDYLARNYGTAKS